MNSAENIIRRGKNHSALLAALTDSVTVLAKAVETLSNQQQQMEDRIAQLETRQTEPPTPHSDR